MAGVVMPRPFHYAIKLMEKPTLEKQPEEKEPKALEVLVDRLEQFAKTTLELVQLKAVNKLSQVVASLASVLVILVFSLMCLLILNIGLALWLGELLGEDYWGFFVVAGFYGLVGCILFVFRDKLIKTPAKNIVVDQALD